MFDHFRSAIRSRQRQKWEKKRGRSKRFFILYRGVLRWGGFMFILTTLTNHFIRHQKLGWFPEVNLLIGCMVSGYIWGLWIWILNEKRFGLKAGQ
jgi:hypothetical protein